jgi:hypothetical protein
MEYQKIYDAEKKDWRIETPFEHLERMLTRLENIRTELQTNPKNNQIRLEDFMLRQEYLGIMKILDSKEKPSNEIINLDNKFEKILTKLNLVYEVNGSLN